MRRGATRWGDRYADTLYISAGMIVLLHDHGIDNHLSRIDCNLIDYGNLDLRVVRPLILENTSFQFYDFTISDDI